MKADDPILVPDVYFTKRKIVEQLDNDEVTVSMLKDKDAKWWVEREDELRFEAISCGEDFYGRSMAELNDELVERMTS